MLYEGCLVVLLIIGLGAPFVYENFWKPVFVNKSDDYFCIAKIERNTMTMRKWTFFYVIYFLIVLSYDDAYQVLAVGDGTRKGTFIVEVVFLCILCLVMFVCCRNHVALPLRRYLNVKEMIDSIEKERFYQVGEDLWYSHSWIRVSTKFYPKCIVTGIRRTATSHKSGLATVYVYTIIGKKYGCNDFLQHDKTLADKVNRLIETLPISRLADLSNGSIRNALRDFIGRDMFDKYMESHTTTEFINSPELLSLVVDRIQKQ